MTPANTPRYIDARKVLSELSVEAKVHVAARKAVVYQGKSRTPVKQVMQHRAIAIIPMSEAAGIRKADTLRLVPGKRYSYWSRTRVKAFVDRGEMRFVDRHNAGATFTGRSAGTWQKTPSGPVCTMQHVVGNKGRYVPVSQREPEVVLG